MAPSDPNVIYVGSGEANIRGNVQPGDGIYKSTNGGKTWKHVWKQKGQIGRIIVHASNANIAYAAVLGSAFGPNPERGVYRTTDGGKTWQRVLAKNPDTGAIDICFDPNNPRILLAAVWQVRRRPWDLTSGGPGSGLYRSEDGGDTWKKIGPKTEAEREAAHEEDDGLPAGPWGRVGIAIAPSDSRRVYALIEAEKGGLYRSDDGGEKWKLMNAGHYLRQRAWYFTQVTVDPANPDVVWCPNVRLLKSIDGGRTFKNFKGPHHVDHHDLWIDPKNPRRMIDSNDGGVDITLNRGETWMAPALPLSQFYHIRVDNRVPYRVMGTMQDLGTASGPSNSLVADGIALSDWHPVGGGESGFVVPDPADPNIVFAGEYGGYLSRYDHGTKQAVNISIYPVNPSGKGAGELKYRFQWTAPVMVSLRRREGPARPTDLDGNVRVLESFLREDLRPLPPRVLYHAANVLFRSNNAGLTWEKISPDLTRNDPSKQQWSGGPITGDNTGAEYYCTIFAIAESPLKEGVLWAGSDDGLVHVSTDDGKNWTNVTKNIPGMPEWGTVTCIEASPHEPGTAYVTVDAHRLDDNRPYLWKTTDYGKSWMSLATGLRDGQFLNVVRQDPKAPDVLYVGSAHRVWCSRDGGKSWQSLKLNMPTAPVTDLVVKGDDLVVGTSGRSVWIFDDLTPIRAWSPKPAKGPHLFAVQPATAWRYQGDRVAGEDRIPGENPPKGAIINYYLENKPKEPLRLEILDSSGKLVRTLTSKKEEPEEEENAPDAPWTEHKPTVLADEPGLHRIAWDLRYEKPTSIPKAKNDAGARAKGRWCCRASTSPGCTRAARRWSPRSTSGSTPRVHISPEALKERHALAMQVYADITRLSNIVIALRSVREQLKQRIKVEPQESVWVRQAEALLPKLDTLEELLHNPKAEVTYDILAQKGGAKLYSQLVPLYNTLMESDAAVTQGIRAMYAEHAKELKRLEDRWQALVTADLARLNEQGRNLPAIVVPRK